ncbi:MAG: hypothetical protein OEZ18_06690 [Candidatus Bathyarchaeota archaeon]|nr:hypothetical protein [Candidatus Bathyarchaeota archaeon]
MHTPIFEYWLAGFDAAVSRYDVGAVSSVGHKTQIITYYRGEINMLLEISSTDVIRLTNGQVKDISE